MRSCQSGTFCVSREWQPCFVHSSCWCWLCKVLLLRRFKELPHIMEEPWKVRTVVSVGLPPPFPLGRSSVCLGRQFGLDAVCLTLEMQERIQTLHHMARSTVLVGMDSTLLCSPSVQTSSFHNTCVLADAAPSFDPTCTSWRWPLSNPKSLRLKSSHCAPWPTVGGS
jgi:hypothetical protein